MLRTGGHIEFLFLKKIAQLFQSGMVLILKESTLVHLFVKKSCSHTLCYTPLGLLLDYAMKPLPPPDPSSEVPVELVLRMLDPSKWPRLG